MNREKEPTATVVEGEGGEEEEEEEEEEVEEEEEEVEEEGQSRGEKRRASCSHYLTYYTGSMPPRPSRGPTSLHLASLGSLFVLLSLAQSLVRSLAFVSLSQRYSFSVALFDVPPEAFLPLARLLRLSLPGTSVYTVRSFLFLPSTHSILRASSSSSSGAATFSFSSPSSSFLLLNHDHPRPPRVTPPFPSSIIHHTPSRSLLCYFSSPRAPPSRTLSSPLVPPRPPPPNILIDRSCIRAQRVALRYRLHRLPPPSYRTLLFFFLSPGCSFFPFFLSFILSFSPLTLLHTKSPYTQRLVALSVLAGTSANVLLLSSPLLLSSSSSPSSSSFARCFLFVDFFCLFVLRNLSRSSSSSNAPQRSPPPLQRESPTRSQAGINYSKNSYCYYYHLTIPSSPGCARSQHNTRLCSRSVHSSSRPRCQLGRPRSGYLFGGLSLTGRIDFTRVPTRLLSASPPCCFFASSLPHPRVASSPPSRRFFFLSSSFNFFLFFPVLRLFLFF